MAKDLKEQIEIMTHYLNGGDVEFKLKNDDRNKWKITSNPSWDWESYEYQIKQQKQKVTIEKWLLKDNNGDFFIREGDKNHIEYAFRNKVKLLETYEVEL